MSTPDESRRMDEERRMIDGVREQLTERFPQFQPSVVAGAVTQAYEALADARIRDFVPVLVHRGASDRLRHAAAG